MVLSRSGGRYRIRAGECEYEATLRGRRKLDGEKRVLVGDRVVFLTHEDGSATLEEVLPRRSLLKRRMPGKQRGIRSVAANLDQVVVVGSLREPDWDNQLMDRFVAVAEANDLPPLLVVNKCDLGEETDAITEPYRLARYDVILSSVVRHSGIEQLRVRLEGRVSLLTGPTGVGKSSLLNALQPGLRLRTGRVSKRTRAGRHTTVAAEMHRFGENGFVVDTPGLRDIGLWGLEPAEVAAAFPEFEKFASRCRFDDCRHLEEPDCAVVRAADSRLLAPSRLESYRRLLDEAVEAARSWR